jgi:hypothetical protein
MRARRREFLCGIAGASAVGLAGCNTLQERPQLLVIENDTAESLDVTTTILEAIDDASTQAPTTSSTTPASTATETPTASGTAVPASRTQSPRHVVDLELTVPANSGKEQQGVLPKNGDYEVLVAIDGRTPGSGTYSDEESVRITISDTTIDVTAFTAERGLGS